MHQHLCVCNNCDPFSLTLSFTSVGGFRPPKSPVLWLLTFHCSTLGFDWCAGNTASIHQRDATHFWPRIKTHLFSPLSIPSKCLRTLENLRSLAGKNTHHRHKRAILNMAPCSVQLNIASTTLSHPVGVLLPIAVGPDMAVMLVLLRRSAHIWVVFFVMMMPGANPTQL